MRKKKKAAIRQKKPLKAHWSWAQVKRLLRSLWRGTHRALRFFLVVFLAYLLQVCVMPYFTLGGVTPSLLFAVIGIVTVCYGKLRAYWTGAIYGILMEIMLPSIPWMNLVLYPISALFWSIFFADKSDKQMELERSMNKLSRNRNVYLRTIFCAGANSLLVEVVHIAYIYLGGTTLTATNYARGVLAVVGTMLLTLFLMLPLRRYLGFVAPAKEKPTVAGRYL